MLRWKLLPRSIVAETPPAMTGRLSLDVEIAVHLVQLPEAYETGAIGVDAATKHGHSSAGATGGNRDVASAGMKSVNAGGRCVVA